MKIVYLMKNKLDENLKLLVVQLLSNSGSLLDTTLEEISRKSQLKRDDVESLIRKMQKRGLAFISHGRFCLTPRGLLFLLGMLEKNAEVDDGGRHDGKECS